METKFGVHSEDGQLRKVMVCAPGRAHQRLTPSNCDDLLFDDVLWVDNAKRDHFDFMAKMRDRGVEVLEMHNLLAETVAVPEAKKWILDNQVTANEVGLDLIDGSAVISKVRIPANSPRPLSGVFRHRSFRSTSEAVGSNLFAMPRASPNICCRHFPTRSIRATRHAGFMTA